MLAGSIFLDLTIIFVTIAIFAFIAKFFKQPLIPIYIIVGILLVPVLNLIHEGAVVSGISQFGIVFLLFIAGLELDFDRLKHVTSVAVLGGSILVVLLILIGLGIAALFGLSWIASIYMGLIFAFSSTMVVVKLLSDKKELDSLHGKIALGLLIIQDIFAIGGFILLTTYNDFSLINLVYLMSITLLILLLIYLSSRYILPKLFAFAAESQELLFIAAIGICLLFASIFGYFVSAEALGIGAFLAGLALANLPYNIEIISRINPLKDFFSMLFFISLGMSLPIVELRTAILPALIFTVLVIFLKPLITFFIISLFGHMPRVAFLTALTQSQISEFGLILAFFGISTGHISQNLFAQIVVMAILSLSISSYLFENKNFLFTKFKRFLEPFSDISEKYSLEYLPKKFRKKFVLLVGYDRLGFSILETLKRMNEIVVVIDFNPEVIKELMGRGIHCVYGDISDSELLENIDLKDCKLVISTIPDKKANIMLMKKSRSINKKVMCFLTSETIADAVDLYNVGADYVIIPRYIGGKHLSLMVKKSKFNSKVILKHKVEQLNELKRRQQHASRHR